MKTALLLVLISIFLSPALPAAEVSTDCFFVMEDLRQEQLTRLSRLEEDFRKAGWEYRKYQETVYTPLWQAALHKNDRFSKEKRIAGEVAFERYRHEADSSQENARQAFRKIETGLDLLDAGFPRNYSCRDTGETHPDKFSDFKNCMEIFIAETGDKLTALRRHLLKYYNDQEAFSEMVETHLSDNPSDHDTFADRFRDYFYSFDIYATSSFLALTRDLRERLETKWPGEACCKACLADRTAGQDPVLNETRLDSQGMEGVAGQVVNNARVLDAFKRFDEETEAEDAEN